MKKYNDLIIFYHQNLFMMIDYIQNTNEITPLTEQDFDVL